MQINGIAGGLNRPLQGGASSTVSSSKGEPNSKATTQTPGLSIPKERADTSAHAAEVVPDRSDNHAVNAYNDVAHASKKEQLSAILGLDVYA